MKQEIDSNNRLVGHTLAVEMSDQQIEEVFGGRWVSDGSGIQTGAPYCLCGPYRDDSPQVWLD